MLPFPMPVTLGFAAAPPDRHELFDLAAGWDLAEKIAAWQGAHRDP